MVNSRGYEDIAHPGPAETVGPLSNVRPDISRLGLSQPLEAKLDRILGMLSRHDEGWWKNDLHTANPGGFLPAGTKVFDGVALTNDLHARSLVIDNTSGYTLQIAGIARPIPAFAINFVVRCWPALSRLDVTISGGQSPAAAPITIFATEEPLSPSGLLSVVGAQLRTTAFGANTLAVVQTGADAADGDSGFDILPVTLMVWQGTSFARLRTPAVFKPQNAVAVAAETTIWTPAAGKKFRLMGVYLQSSVAGNLLLRDNTAGVIIAVIPSAAAGDASVVDLGNGILSAAANNVLTCTGPAASTVSGIVFGTEE